MPETRKTTPLALRVCPLLLCLVMLAGCFGSKTAGGLTDPWPLADGAVPLEELLPNEDLRDSALRVLNSPRPWKLSGIDAAAGTDLIEGLPNELDQSSQLARFLGIHPWQDAYKSIRKGEDYHVTYVVTGDTASDIPEDLRDDVADYIPEGYTCVEAFASGIDEDRHPCMYEFLVIMRTEDAVPVLAAMTSITTDGSVTL